MVGTTVGNYRITRLLGEGGMGMVYLAEHPAMGRLAAVKVLHPHLANDTQILTRFFNEARAAHAIQHPGIVEIYDSGPLPSGGAYITMEFLDGESLAARLRRGRIPLPEVIDIGAQAADALGAAHAKGIVHRDLKPDNLYLIPDYHRTGSLRVKILDFGIAKLNTAQLGSGSVRTRTGAVMGTPLYMSPEQVRGTREVDHRSDIYALGVILYEMICGRPPFVSDGFGELAHMHISEPPAPPRNHAPELPRQIEQALLKALAKDPAARFPSMAELQRAIGGAPTLVLGPGGVAASGADRPSQPMSVTTLAGSATAFEMKLTRSGRSRRRVGLVVGGAGALAALAAVLVTRREPQRPPPPPAPEVAVVVPRPDLAPAPGPLPGQRAQAPARTVEVRIDSNPPAARLRRERDGVLIGETPFAESWQRGKGTEKLRLERAGYRVERVQVPLDSGVTARVSLKKEREPAPAPVRRAARPKPLSAAPPKWDQLPVHTPGKWDAPLKASPPATTMKAPEKI